MASVHNLTVGHCNIQGGLIGISKSTQILDMIKKYKMDILSLNETNLNDTIATQTLNIPVTYTFLRNDRGTGSRGGCGLIISNKLAYDDKIKVNTTLSNIESKWIKVKGSNIYICGFYRSNRNCKLDNFLDYFTECMNKLKGKKVIWIGDINVDQNKINDLDYRKLDSTLKSFNMIQTIQRYTRVARKGNTFTYSTIDVIITNCYADFENSSEFNIFSPLGKSDHVSIIVDLNIFQPEQCYSTEIDDVKRNWSKVNLLDILKLSKNVDWCYSKKPENMSIEEMWEEIHGKLCKVSELVPESYDFSNKGCLSMPWINSSLKRAIRAKNKSIGQHCSVVFGNLSGSDAHTQACNPRSLYGMTRMSQDFFKHHIEAGTIENGTRYSLTFRSLSSKNRNTTCIIGDSNTGRLKFGSDPRQSFGDLLPGKQVYSPVLDEINPYVCAGYRNVVLLCGVNDLRKECVKSEKDVHNIFRKFVQKIEQIQSINPHCRIYVCPILPTKLVNINRRAACFNGLIFNELVSSNFGVTVVNGFDSFLDNEGLLHQNLSKRLNKHQRPDFLHLNWKGSAQLAKLIKNTIFHRASNMVNGRSYRDVAAPGLGENHNGYQPV